MIYNLLDLRAPFVIQAHHILDLRDGHSIGIAPFPDALSDIQANALSAVLQRNVNDMTEFVYIMPITVIRQVQKSANLWRNARMVRIDPNAAFNIPDNELSEYSKLIITLLERRCSKLGLLGLFYDPDDYSKDHRCLGLNQAGFVRCLEHSPFFTKLLLSWSVSGLADEESREDDVNFLDYIGERKIAVQDQFVDRFVDVVHTNIYSNYSAVGHE